METKIETKDGIKVFANEVCGLRQELEDLQITWRHHRATSKIRADLEKIRDIANEMLESVT